MKKLMVIVLVFIIIVGLAGCKRREQSNDFAEQYRAYGENMLILGLKNDTEPTENGVVYLDDITDNLNIQFANLSENDSEYVLKLFLDYNEIPYWLDGQEISEHIFTLNAGQSVVFPVTLSGDIPFETSHILTVAIFTAPNKHAYAIDLMSNSYGVVLSYELANRNAARSLASKTQVIEPQNYLSLSFQGIMLNEDFKIGSGSMVKFPPKKIEAKKGEKIKLAYRVGNYETVDDIVVVLLVDWKQKEINNAPYMYITNKKGFLGYGTLEFDAPTNPGEYEITAFAVEDPFGLKTADNFHSHDTSYRFTLVVK